MSEVFSDEYCREVSAAYWAEEEEMKAGIHPSQVKERIEKALFDLGYHYEEISYLDWYCEQHIVRVHTDGSYFGTFDYVENIFISTPESRVREGMSMELVIEDITDEELEILEKNDVDWVIDDLLDDHRNISINGSKKYITEVLNKIGRCSNDIS